MDKNYPSLSIRMNSGDCLFLYTDCMIEGQNEQGQAYEETRIMEALRRAPAGNARNILDYLMSDFYRFHNTTTFKDDLTAVLIQKR
jgi:phosphoserine phosphatase RsbU/P